MPSRYILEYRDVTALNMRFGPMTNLGSNAYGDLKICQLPIRNLKDLGGGMNQDPILANLIVANNIYIEAYFLDLIKDYCIFIVTAKIL